MLTRWKLTNSKIDQVGRYCFVHQIWTHLSTWHQHHDSVCSMMQWLPYHCESSWVNFAPSQCILACQEAQDQSHVQNEHLKMPVPLWLSTVVLTKVLASIISPICIAYSPRVECPNCLQTTWASYLSHRLWQIVPHTLSIHISTLPSLGVDPPFRRIWPSVQFAGTGINKHIYLHRFEECWYLWSVRIYLHR